MPAQPKPIERHLATAQNGRTLGGRELEVIDISGLPEVTAPPIPAGLAERGTSEWLKIWQAGKWLYPDQDYAWVEQVVRAYDDLDQFRKTVAEEGLTVQGYNGQTVAHPLIREMRACEDTIRKCLSQLGFSPTDRARLKLTELKGEVTLQALNAGITASSPAMVQGYVEGSW